MTKTPRVDAAAERGSDHGLGNTMMSGIWPLARQLEQENAELVAHLAALVAWIDGEQMYPNDDALSSARALLAKVNA